MAKPAEFRVMERDFAAMGHSAAGMAGESAVANADAATGPAIDLVHLSHQTLGDSALETELLSLFDRQAQQFAGRLSEPLQDGETRWRADLAHTLKGSARAIGAFGLARAAEDYETAIRSGGVDIDARLGRLVAAIGVARGAIANLLGRA